MKKIGLILTLVILGVMGVGIVRQKKVLALDLSGPRGYPPIISTTLAWPGPDIVGMKYANGSGIGWAELPWDNDTAWQNTIKPKLKTYIEQKIYPHLGITDSTPSKKAGLSIGFVWPNMLSTESKNRAFVRRVIDLAREMDQPMNIRLVANHWWSSSYDNQAIWKSEVNPNWDKAVEWWGWSKDYVWADQRVRATSKVKVQWRDWGGAFELDIPQPRFSSTEYRNVYLAKSGPLMETLALEYNNLKKDGKAYLLTGFAPDTEAMPGMSYSPEPSTQLQLGVNSYIQRHCPADVLICLPPKPSNVTREEWITQKSLEYWRPDDYGEHLVEETREYEEFLRASAVARGLPEDKLIMHIAPILYWKQGDHKNFTSAGRAAVVGRAIPAYSYYEAGDPQGLQDRLDMTKVIEDAKTAGATNYMLQEFFAWGSYADWKSTMAMLTDNTNWPKLSLINFQNWAGMAVDNEGNQITDDNFYSGAVLMKDMLANYLASCGNGWIEKGEVCETQTSWSCKIWDSKYISGETGCSADCKTVMVNNCLSKPGDATGDGKTDLADFVRWKREFTGALTTKTADFNNDGSVSLADFVVWKKNL